MLTLAIRTDNPQAQLIVYEGHEQSTEITWEAHRELAETLHIKIKEILDSQHKTLHDLQGLILFKGPGSFTGLRIGASVANALAASLDIPIVSANGTDWNRQGVAKLLQGNNERVITPEYGALPHITQPKK